MFDKRFSASAEDKELILSIAERAVKLSPKTDKMTLMMSLEAVHCVGCPLKLTELLGASDADFLHDVFGIARHIDTKTGNLENCFLPRFAA